MAHRLDLGPEVLSRADAEALGRRILSWVTAPQAQIRLSHTVSADTDFSRGDTDVMSEGRNFYLDLSVTFRDHSATASTTDLDEVSLKRFIADTEAMAKAPTASSGPVKLLEPQLYPTPPKRFFEATPPAMTGAARAEIFREFAEACEAADLIAAGMGRFYASAFAVMNSAGLFGYDTSTYGGMGLTARTKDGTGSGYATGRHEDWSRVRRGELMAKAVDLAKRSARPVAVEPGRYTVILEPIAVASLIGDMIQLWSAQMADAGYTAYSKNPVGTNKIGLKMIDERLSVISDPWDSEMPLSVVAQSGEALGKVVWFDHGILKNLEYDRAYAAVKNREMVLNPGGARLSADGPTTSLEEMIASTKRGIWVNRISGGGLMSFKTMLMTGVTRDGTFLIENGKITKPIKNMRFNESPFFILNRLEAFGEPVRASYDAVAPRLKVRDFDFTSLTDAV